MDHEHECEHKNCTGASANASLCQTLSEMDWERGLWYAVFSGDKDRVNMLIDKARNAKETVNAPDNAGYAPLHYAARKGYVDICKVLLENGADINVKTRSGKATPLHKAAVAGKIETVNFLIKSGSSVDTPDVDGQTVLHKATLYQHFELNKILLIACPGLASIKDNKGRVAADYAASRKE